MNWFCNVFSCILGHWFWSDKFGQYSWYSWFEVCTVLVLFLLMISCGTFEITGPTEKKLWYSNRCQTNILCKGITQWNLVLGGELLIISPLFSDILRGVIDDVVASIVVLPNKITVPLTNIDPYELKYPLPDVSKAWHHPGHSFS